MFCCPSHQRKPNPCFFIVHLWLMDWLTQKKECTIKRRENEGVSFSPSGKSRAWTGACNHHHYHQGYKSSLLKGSMFGIVGSLAMTAMGKKKCSLNLFGQTRECVSICVGCVRACVKEAHIIFSTYEEHSPASSSLSLYLSITRSKIFTFPAKEQKCETMASHFREKLPSRCLPPSPSCHKKKDL